MSEYPEQNLIQNPQVENNFIPYIPQAPAYSPGVPGYVPLPRLAKPNQAVVIRTKTKIRVTERHKWAPQEASDRPLPLSSLIKTCQPPADSLRGRKVKGFLPASDVAELPHCNGLCARTAHCAHGKVVGQLTFRDHFHTTQCTLYFLTFCRHILPWSTGWLNWSRWMLKWSGRRKFVVYVVGFVGI